MASSAWRRLASSLTRSPPSRSRFAGRTTSAGTTGGSPKVRANVSKAPAFSRTHTSTRAGKGAGRAKERSVATITERPMWTSCRSERSRTVRPATFRAAPAPSSAVARTRTREGSLTASGPTRRPERLLGGGALVGRVYLQPAVPADVPAVGRPVGLGQAAEDALDVDGAAL